jgi:hypothetical protein
MLHRQRGTELEAEDFFRSLEVFKHLILLSKAEIKEQCGPLS